MLARRLGTLRVRFDQDRAVARVLPVPQQVLGDRGGEYRHERALHAGGRSVTVRDVVGRWLMAMRDVAGRVSVRISHDAELATSGGLGEV